MLLALNGNIGAGKSEVAKYLRDHHSFARIRFAHYIKETLRLWGFNDNEIDGYLKEVPCERILNIVPRHAQRILGTEVGRNINTDLWAFLWRTNLAIPLLNAGTSVVADDLRFPNEREEVKRLGGFCVRIEREGTESNLSTHESDIHKIECDFVIENNGSVQDLQRMVGKLVTHIQTL